MFCSGERSEKERKIGDKRIFGDRIFSSVLEFLVTKRGPDVIVLVSQWSYVCFWCVCVCVCVCTYYVCVYEFSCTYKPYIQIYNTQRSIKASKIIIFVVMTNEFQYWIWFYKNLKSRGHCCHILQVIMTAYLFRWKRWKSKQSSKAKPTWLLALYYKLKHYKY